MPSQPRCSESIAVLLKDYDGNVGFMAYRKLADYGIDVTPWKTVCSAQNGASGTQCADIYSAYIQ